MKWTQAVVAAVLWLPAGGPSLAGEQGSSTEWDLRVDVSTTPDSFTVPSGFTRTNVWTGRSRIGGSGTAVQVYRKDYSGGSPDYVTVVDLRYATLTNLNGSTRGEPCCTISKRHLCSSSGSTPCVTSSHWKTGQAADTSNKALRVMVNGTFFQTAYEPTGIAFGLKKAGSVCSYGYGVSGRCGSATEHPGEIRILAFNGAANRAVIQTYSTATFDGTSPDVVGGLSPTCCKSPSSYLRRTLVGLRDDNGDGDRELVILFSSAYATLTGADAVLRNFGATERIQLDGGGSTGLLVGGAVKVNPIRAVPHALAVYSGQD